MGNYEALAKNTNGSIVYKGDFKVELSSNDTGLLVF